MTRYRCTDPTCADHRAKLVRAYVLALIAERRWVA